MSLDIVEPPLKYHPGLFGYLSVGVVAAANFNSPGQIVIAGEKAAVERARSEEHTSELQSPC